MKILIISAKAGMGHIKTAEALEKNWALTNPEIKIKNIELTDFIDSFSKKIFFESYEIMIKKIPKLWDFFYKKTENEKKLKTLNFLTQLLKKMNSSKLKKEIDNFLPDVIVSTHFAPTDIILNQIKFKKPVFTLITDYAPHRIWINKKNSAYFVGSQYTKNLMSKYNIDKEKIIVSGIPVQPDFYKKIKNLNIKNYKKQKTILLMPSQTGKIKTENLINKILNLKSYNLQLLVICGKNKTLKEKLEKIKSKNLKIFGLTDNIFDLMIQSDLIITKAGGITITEALTLQKPLILINPVPGQEEENVKFLEKNKYGILAKTIDETIEKIQAILNKDIQLKSWVIIKNPAQIILKKIKN